MTSIERRNAAAERFAAIGVKPKEANELHEPGRIREAHKAGWNEGRKDLLAEIKKEIAKSFSIEEFLVCGGFDMFEV